ncbi:autotransporter outer membrane beta-barrel domain-containing protein [Salmonella enterica]|nr:autotransporter outer membrane beta-barrel domain-containing protein [Salmonella enterica]
MENKLRPSHIATCISLILGSGLALYAPLTFSACGEYNQAGTCGLAEFTMTSPKMPLPTAWYFVQPTQEAAINTLAKAQNIYFGGGSAIRKPNDSQSLLVDGANLSGYYINASKEGSATIALVNHATVDWLEAGGSKTNIHVLVDNSTLNGANAETDYDRTEKKPNYSKNYAKGMAIYLSYTDGGDHLVDIVNDSTLNGSVISGGAGIHQITLTDSEIKKGNILLSGANNDNAIILKNALIDTRDAISKTASAISITSTNHKNHTNTVTLEENSRLIGALNMGSSGGHNSVELRDGSHISATTTANAINITSGLTTQLALDRATIDGDTLLTASNTIATTMADSQLNGDVVLKKAASANLIMTGSGLSGSIDASAISGDVSVYLDNSDIAGDVILNNGTVTRADVFLDNTVIGGHLYGSDNSTLTLGENIHQFQGDKFSRFSNLNASGTTSLNGGFSDDNVGVRLQVNDGTFIAPVNLSQGQLVFNQARLIADTLALRESASLELTNHSLLETHSAQLFQHDDEAATLFTPTGTRLTLNNSTLALTDETYELEYLKSINTLLGDQTGSRLVMMGTLLDNNIATGTATLDDAATAGAVLAKVEVTADKNQLRIGSATPASDDEQAVENSFGAAKLSLGGVGDAVVSIVGGKALTLTGASGTQLIDMAGQPDASVTVNVENGALNLGAIVVGDTVNVLQGTVNVGETGALNIIAGDHTIEDKSGSGVTSAGQITILHNAALHTNVTLAGSGELAVNGALQANALNAQSDTLITVGNTENAGLLRADNVDLQGARMFIDPQWQANPTLKDASRVALNGETVNGRLTVGQNALLVLGDTDTHTAETDFAESGLRWSPDGITAALAIERAQYLNPTQGGLRVDGALHSGAGDYDATFNQAEFGERSLLMVNRDSTSGGNAALTASSGTLKVADTATLYVKDAIANQTYTIAKGFSDVELAGSGWQNERLILNKLLNATTMEHDGSVIVSTLAKKAEDVLPGVVPVHALDQMINSGTNSLTSPWAGIRFLSQAVDDPQASVHEVVKTVNSAAQLAIAGGVQASTLATGLAASQAIQDRTSLANRALQREDAVWVQALYGNQRARDFSAGNMDYGYDSDYYGLMLGADATLESDSGKWRTGAALHAGHGNTDSRGDFNSTHNDVDFWGISLYQNWSNGRVNVTGDIGYNASSNDIEQKIPGWMNAGSTLKGSPDSQLITAGITGEYLISTQAIDILPHAGVRYNQLKTKGFTTKNTHREAVFTTQEETLDIWQFPVGVKLNKTFDLDAGWGLSTQADFAVITNTGDTQSATKVSAVGINASDGISANFIDKTTFAGQIGVKLQKGDMRWGLGYSVNTSSHNTDQMINATWQLSF